ncbi:MAG TPA: cellulase family glycosylhydrolase, partial [Candidatus Acidoferrales bacterium]|nr:cellulase family glycosylhydrolase [Candidatus Acidoferrales bacterium]
MRRAAAGLLVAVLALLSYPGADLAALHARLRRSPAALDSGGAPLPWLHVEHPPRGTAFIADPEGRRVILRGVVAGGLMDFWSGSDSGDESPPPLFPIDPAAYEQGRCPANFATVRVPPLCRNDLAEMSQLGFNVLRLALSWSLLEPQPGAYDRTYLDRVAQVVGWARAEGVYVMLDMHEN